LKAGLGGAFAPTCPEGQVAHGCLGKAAIETPTESDGLCIHIRPFSQLFDGYGNSTANDDQNEFEFFKFRCAVIHDRERCSASRLHYYPVIGKESLACDYGGPIRDHETAKRMLL
jgi:hypothetical protein